jgi:hypothetical protein
MLVGIPRGDPLLLALLACATAMDSGGDDSGGDDSGDSAAPTGPAVLQLSFAMDTDLVADMTEPPAGIFRGSIYAEDDASAVGPADGAESLVDFVSEAIDLAGSGGPSAVAWTSDPLDPQTLWVLGCLDVDDNDCDCKDPITYPYDVKFAVVPGDNPLTVRMELLHPC